jgi:Lar family restriction alleviation protein
MSELKPYPFYGGGVDFVKDTYMGDELLPCPFCGSTDTEIVAGINDENTLHMVGHVTCMNCGASSGWWRDRNTAIEKWNRRSYE